MAAQADLAAKTAAVDRIMMRFRNEVLTPAVRADVGRAWAEFEQSFPAATATMDDYAAHVLHAVEVAGEDHVGIGCDLDGGGGFAGLREVSDYPMITRALRARGLSEAALGKIWGGNTLRLMRDVARLRSA
jgi:membrane dipeptidase